MQRVRSRARPLQTRHVDVLKFSFFNFFSFIFLFCLDVNRSQFSSHWVSLSDCTKGKKRSPPAPGDGELMTALSASPETPRLVWLRLTWTPRTKTIAHQMTSFHSWCKPKASPITWCDGAEIVREGETGVRWTCGCCYGMTKNTSANTSKYAWGQKRTDPGTRTACVPSSRHSPHVWIPPAAQGMRFIIFQKQTKNTE